MCEMSEMDWEEDMHVSKNNSKLFSVQEESAQDIQCNFSSLPNVLVEKPYIARKVSSDPNFGYKINYDDLCGPWSCPEISAYQKYDIPLVPKICTWIFIEESDMLYMRKFLADEEAILTLIGNKLLDNKLFNIINKNIFLQLMWEVFRFARDNYYTEEAISSLLGLFYFTHRYFLTTPWRTPTETYKFFKEGVLLHSVLDPPKSDEIFTPKESEQILDLFCMTYMRQLPLIRFICLPNYQLILTIERDSPQSPKTKD